MCGDCAGAQSSKSVSRAHALKNKSLICGERGMQGERTRRPRSPRCSYATTAAGWLTSQHVLEQGGRNRQEYHRLTGCEGHTRLLQHFQGANFLVLLQYVCPLSTAKNNFLVNLAQTFPTVPVLLHRLIRAALEGRGSGDCCEVWRLAACRADLQVMLQLLPSVGNGRLRLVLHLFSPAEANTRAQIDVEENTASQCTSARNPPAAPCRWQVGRNGSNQSAGGRDGVPRAQQRVGL